MRRTCVREWQGVCRAHSTSAVYLLPCLRGAFSLFLLIFRWGAKGRRGRPRGKRERRHSQVWVLFMMLFPLATEAAHTSARARTHIKNVSCRPGWMVERAWNEGTEGNEEGGWGVIPLPKSWCIDARSRCLQHSFQFRPEHRCIQFPKCYALTTPAASASISLACGCSISLKGEQSNKTEIKKMKNNYFMFSTKCSRKFHANSFIVTQPNESVSCVSLVLRTPHSNR